MIVDFNDISFYCGPAGSFYGWKPCTTRFTGIARGADRYIIIHNGHILGMPQELEFALLHPAIIRYELFAV